MNILNLETKADLDEGHNVDTHETKKEVKDPNLKGVEGAKTPKEKKEAIEKGLKDGTINDDTDPFDLANAADAN